MTDGQQPPYRKVRGFFVHTHHRGSKIAIVDNRVWLGNHESERNAIGAAKAYGLCVENYGIKVDKIEPLTKKAIVWHKIDGYSVWKND